MWPFGKSTVDRVKDAFKAQALLAPLNLDVRVDSGVAYITGQIPTDKYTGLVKVVASGIDGVKSVDTSGLIAAAQSAPTAPTVSVDSGSVDSGTTEVQASAPVGYDDAQADEIVAQAVAEHNRIAKGVWNAIKANGELKTTPSTCSRAAPASSCKARSTASTSCTWPPSWPAASTAWRPWTPVA